MHSDEPWTVASFVDALAKRFQEPKPKQVEAGDTHYPNAEYWGTFYCGDHVYLEQIYIGHDGVVTLALGS